MGYVILPSQRNATRIGDTDYYRVEQYINELFYTVKIFTWHQLTCEYRLTKD